MIKQFTLLSIALSICFISNGQLLEQLREDDLVLSIVQATIDGDDCTELYLQNDAFLAFYNRDSVTYFANAWQKSKSQSYGEAILLEHKETDEEITYRALWKYANTYNEETGKAVIYLRLFPRPITVGFEICIITEKASLMIFRGYVNDRLLQKPF